MAVGEGHVFPGLAPWAKILRPCRGYQRADANLNRTPADPSPGGPRYPLIQPQTRNARTRQVMKKTRPDSTNRRTCHTPPSLSGPNPFATIKPRRVSAHRDSSLPDAETSLRKPGVVAPAIIAPGG